MPGIFTGQAGQARDYLLEGRKVPKQRFLRQMDMDEERRETPPVLLGNGHRWRAGRRRWRPTTNWVWCPRLLLGDDGRGHSPRQWRLRGGSVLSRSGR